MNLCAYYSRYCHGRKGNLLYAPNIYMSKITIAPKDEVRKAGGRVYLISGGDVSAAISTCIEVSGVGVLFGFDSAPPGVFAAATLRSVGGDMQVRLVTRNAKNKERCLAEH